MCKYCDDEEVNKVKLDNENYDSDGVYIDGCSIEISVCHETAYFTANYCPVCGRNLKETDK